jgi:uncharacterized membrane protein
MKKPVPCVMLVCALVGMAIASYDCVMIFADRLLWCPPPIDGCNTVAYSPEGRIWGVPIGFFGVVFYAVMLALAAALAFSSSSRPLRLVVLLYTVVGVCGSIGFLYLDLTRIHAFCIYCLISGIDTVVLLVSAISYYRAVPEGVSRLPAVSGRKE